MNFYFILKVLVVLKIFNFFPDFFHHVGKRLDKKTMANFKIHNVTNWITKICNKHIDKYLKK